MRKAQAKKRLKLPDEVYQSIIVSQLINQVMAKGKKNLARQIVYRALNTLNENHKEALTIFETAIENLKPKVELKSRKVGGAKYRVPIQVAEYRQTTLALRWLKEAALARNEKDLALRLSNEIKEASKKNGQAMKKRETVHKMAEANKAFAFYSW